MKKLMEKLYNVILKFKLKLLFEVEKEDWWLIVDL